MINMSIVTTSKKKTKKIQSLQSEIDRIHNLMCEIVKKFLYIYIKCVY